MGRVRLSAALVALSCVPLASCFLFKRPDAPVGATQAPPQPPLAARNATVLELHGERRVDEYAWMRNRDSSEVLAHLEAENAYSRAMMRSTEPLQEQLYQEFRARAPGADEGPPSVRRGEYEYYSRVQEGKPHPLYCRKRVAPGANEEVILDLNLLAEEDDYVDLGSFEVSDDGNYLAYSLDGEGARSYSLYVKDLRTGQLGPEQITQVTSVSWAADRTLFYTVENAEQRPYRVYRHRLGDAEDTLVREELDPRFSLQVWRSRSKAYVLLGALGTSATEVAFVPADQPLATPQIIARRREHHEYYVEQRGEWFFIRTNDKGPNFRVVVAPVATPSESNWRELTPSGASVAIEELAVFRDFLVVHEREAGLPMLRVSELKPIAAAPRATPARNARKPANVVLAAPVVEASARVAMPEPVYDLHAEENPDFDAASYRFSYESLTSPTTYYDYRVKARALSLVKRAALPAGYDPSRYREERLSARAADGTKIPISLVYRVDKPPGPRPMLLEAYGAYGYPFPTTFSATRVSLLDRGFIHAIAHVRGGGELGERWHEQGRLLNKRNSFADFIAAAEQLIGDGYTKPDRLAIEGASAGGLLVAAVINERPELFRAALLDVPFVDVLNTMSDPDLPLTDAEYEEWGNPANAEQYRYMKSYCPYTNIQRKEYPTLLLKTSYDDSEVMYWEPAKYVARMRARAPGRPVLLQVNLGGEDEDDSSRPDELRERAFDYAFLLTQVGRPEPSSTAQPAAAAGAAKHAQAPTILSGKAAKPAR